MLGETAPQPCHEAVSKALWEEMVRACWRAQEGDPEDVTFKPGLGEFCRGQGERRGGRRCQHREQSGPKSRGQEHRGVGEQRGSELQARKGSVRRAPRPRLSWHTAGSQDLSSKRMNDQICALLERSSPVRVTGISDSVDPLNCKQNQVYKAHIF